MQSFADIRAHGGRGGNKQAEPGPRLSFFDSGTATIDKIEQREKQNSIDRGSKDLLNANRE